MGQPTIEFSSIPDDTAQHSRQFFRVPVNEDHFVSIYISNVGYRVSEISQTGAGLLLEDNQAFEIGEHTYPCCMQYEDICLADLTGQIVHCSLYEGFWKFGLQWIGMNDSQKKQMACLLDKLKKHVMVSLQPSEPEQAGRGK